MIALIHDDLVIGRATGIVGPEIPLALIDLPDARLRLDDGAVVDVGSEPRTFFIDAAGLKHLRAAPGRVALECSYDAKLVTDGVGGWRVLDAVEAAKAALIDYLKDLRWQREQAGTVWNGWPIHTDDRSQGKYLAELQAIALDDRVDGDLWKFADGLFRPVPNADFPALAKAARAHVRTMFGIEATVLAAIEAGMITTTAEVDAAFAG